MNTLKTYCGLRTGLGLCLGLFLLLWLAFSGNGQSAGHSHPRILCLNSYDYDWDSVPKQLTGLNKVLDSHAKIDYIFMDTKKYSYEDVKPDIYDQVQAGLSHGAAYDMVLVQDDAALDFVLEYRSELFNGIPIVFEGINTEEKADMAVQDPLITGLVESFPMEDTITLAQKLYPKAGRIVAIADDSESCLGSLAQYRDAQAQFPGLSFEVMDCSKLTEQQIVDQLGSYDEDTILLFLMMSHNADGYDYTQFEAARLASESAHIPIFKADELGIGDGLLGGVVISYEQMGAQAGEMALSILQGQSRPLDLPLKITPYGPLFDENVLNRFAISPGLLPNDTQLVNHVMTRWERYHQVLIPAGIIILLLSLLLINTLIWKQRQKRYFANLHEKDIMLDNLLRGIPGGIAVYKINQDKVETLYSSEGVPLLGGRTMEEYQKWIQGDLFGNTIYEQDLPIVRHTVMTAVAKRETIDLTYRLKHKDGSNVWVQLTAAPIRYEDDCPVYYAVYTRVPQQAILYRKISTDSPTGLYVCDRQNYNMLYANQIVAKTLGGDNNYIGRKCYEYLIGRTEPCPWCHMDQMTKDSYLVREFSAPNTGRHLIMRGKTIDWNGIEAHIEYVTDNTYRHNMEQQKENRYQYQMNLMSRLSRDYIDNYQLNITKGVVTAGFNKASSTSIELPTDAKTFIEKMTAGIPVKLERDMYIQCFSQEHLLARFAEGQDQVVLEYRFAYDGHPMRWHRSTAVMTQNPTTNEIVGYIYTADIHTDKIHQLLTSVSLETANNLLFCIDLAHNTHIMFRTGKDTTPTYAEDSQRVLEEGLLAQVPESQRDALRYKMILPAIQQGLAEHSTYTLFYQLETPDGPRYKKSSYTWLDQEFSLVSLLITDITDIHQQQTAQQEQLQQALEAAKAASQAKTAFLSRMSHDMRTPMNGILGLTYIMEAETDAAKIHRDLPKLRETGQYLLQLINDVLDVNKVESGNLELHPTVCQGRAIMEAILSMLQPQIAAKKLNFQLHQKNVQWTYAKVDVQRVKQIFVNLLSNAIKFTPEGGRIECTMETIERTDAYVCDKFTIRDTGIGMSEEFQQRLFEPFAQENRALESNLTGTGLGLAIVKKLVELMDGNITVKSRINEGTAFTLYLKFPLANSPTDSALPLPQGQSNIPLTGNAAPAVGSQQLHHAHILLCEDNELNAQIAQWLLEQQGAMVTWKTDGQQGLDEFAASDPHHYDIILMDVSMPVMDGLTATKHIRALDRPDAKTVPILAMTANAYPEDIQRSMDVGMDAHLPKPIEPTELYQTLGRFFSPK